MKEDELYESFVKAKLLHDKCWNDFSLAHSAFQDAKRRMESAWNIYQGHLQRTADQPSWSTE